MLVQRTADLPMLDNGIALLPGRFRRKEQAKKRTPHAQPHCNVKYLKRSEDEDDEAALEAKYLETLKKPAKISKFICGEGGDIQLHGCSLEFPPCAVKERKEMTMSVDNNPENCPPNLEPIALILGFKPSVKFDEPVTVTMKTWFRAHEGERIPVVLLSRKAGNDWKKVGETTVGDTNEVKFAVKHFCEIVPGIEPEQAANGDYDVSNDVFIKRETGLIRAVFYLDSKTGADIMDDARRRSFASLAPNSLAIRGKREQTVSVKVNLTQPPGTNLEKRSPSKPLRIRDILQRSGQQHNIILAPNPRFGDYNGLVEGEYIAELDGKEVDGTVLERQWPVTLDPEGPPIHNTTNIAAGLVAKGHSKVECSLANSATVQTSIK